ncbi:transcriptional regulator [Haliangium ochraceum]|uniref:Response regulator receiver protein n=1 Tax=Haliangium ochraceum (strain DSM 14365 / JCM 11303 / SMP-2) TaxID=502025 RepID=D0LNY7_HALO1|nr:transcriptional regulator [Haliangium ochraceum]ACY18813.1 response regulator receiver protein [Haliangium ochraceum DSM 14365]
MRGKHVLFQDPEPQARRIAERALNATGSTVALISSPSDIAAAIADKQPDLLMLNFDALSDSEVDWLGTLQTPLVLHTTATTEEYLPRMANRDFLRNMIAKRGDPFEPEELIITAEKILREELFGLQKYLVWGVEPSRLRIVRSDEKPAYIRAVTDYAELLGCNSRTTEMVRTVVDELVTNAIYNAPRDADGCPKYAHLSRRESVVLDESEVAELLFACDGSYIAIAQRDPFGSLTGETVISYLNRCLHKGPRQISTDAGGAGLGLYQVFQSLSKFIINIEPGRRTEVICLIDLRLSMRRFREAPKSFHIFVCGTGACHSTP